jgi:hypothetical protein
MLLLRGGNCGRFAYAPRKERSLAFAPCSVARSALLSFLFLCWMTVLRLLVGLMLVPACAFLPPYRDMSASLSCRIFVDRLSMELHSLSVNGRAPSLCSSTLSLYSIFALEFCRVLQRIVSRVSVWTRPFFSSVVHPDTASMHRSGAVKIYVCSPAAITRSDMEAQATCF